MESVSPGTTLRQADREMDFHIQVIGELATRVRAHPLLDGTIVLGDSEQGDHWLSTLEGAQRQRMKRFLRDRSCLLHFDIHGGNVLENHNGWRLIDPTPRIGPAVAETHLLLTDALKHQTDAEIERRILLYCHHAELDPTETFDYLSLRCLTLEAEMPHRPDWQVEMRALSAALTRIDH